MNVCASGTVISRYLHERRPVGFGGWEGSSHLIFLPAGAHSQADCQHKLLRSACPSSPSLFSAFAFIDLTVDFY